MKFINNNDILDPAINLAIEEYALNELNINESYLLFYSMTPTVIVGKNQNTLEEINMDYVREQHVNVTRRLSGGGAVYNDEGDLSFSFITKDDGDSFNNYKKFTEPVISALHKLGVPAELQGRNDLVVKGKKISGNAQFSTKGRMFSHGTLMFDVNLENVTMALNPDPEKYQSKGIKSVRSRVTNIREHLAEDMDIHQFKESLLVNIFDGEVPIPEHRLTESDWDRIHQIAKTRYRNWEWVYGRSPTFNARHKHRFTAGLVDLRLEIHKGLIESASIYGDFFGVGEIEDVENLLTGIKYDQGTIGDAINSVDIQYYFGKIEMDEFLKMLF